MQKPEVFWGELSPAAHIVQIYDEADVMLDALEGFVAGGLRSGDAVIIIATPMHLNALDARLLVQGFDLHALRESHQYISRDAVDTLAQFMANDWPDEKLFAESVSSLLTLA